MEVANSLQELPPRMGDPTALPEAGNLNLDFLLKFKERVYGKIGRWFPIPSSELDSYLNWFAKTVGAELAGFLGFLAKSAPALGLEIVFFVLALFYGIMDGSKLNAYIQKVLPFDIPEYQQFKTTSQQITRGVILGSLLSGITQGLLIGIGFWIFGVPRPFFFGLMTLVFSFIPFVGSVPAGLGGAIYLFANERTGAAIGVLIFFGVATLSDNIIKPWALKGKSELHALVALISVLGGLGLFGFSGIFLGPLSAALAIEGFNLLIRNKANIANGNPRRTYE
jgi:predicted PurR-regulated permease PerM